MAMVVILQASAIDPKISSAAVEPADAFRKPEFCIGLNVYLNRPQASHTLYIGFFTKLPAAGTPVKKGNSAAYGCLRSLPGLYSP